MATFTIQARNAKMAANSQRLRKRLEREATGVSTEPGSVRWIQDPVDLRGLPAIGRGVAGEIRYTRPGANLR